MYTPLDQPSYLKAKLLNNEETYTHFFISTMMVSRNTLMLFDFDKHHCSSNHFFNFLHQKLIFALVHFEKHNKKYNKI